MKGSNGNSPIPLPTIVDDPRWIGRFSREVRQSIAALRDRKPKVANGRGESDLHPWKIMVAYDAGSTQLRGYVGAGRITISGMRDGDTYPLLKEVRSRFGASTALVNDPFADFSTLGYEVLTAGSVYGVWAKVCFSANPESLANNMPTYSGQQFDNLLNVQIGGTSRILFSEDFQEPYDSIEVGLGEGFSGGATDALCFYLGQVTVNAEGDGASIKQYRKSDIFIPMLTFTQGIRVVSEDLFNDITEGSDGGAYYNAP